MAGNISIASEEKTLIELHKLLILETELDPVLIAMDDSKRNVNIRRI